MSYCLHPIPLAALLFGICMADPAHGMARPKFVQFPPEFKWCVATSAHQVEGYNTESDWWDWENLPPKCDSSDCRCTIKNCEKSGAAADHWNRLDEDLGLLKELGVRQYRFSIEWAKIEPTEGQWNWSAIERYRREVRILEQMGIEPMITLQHFSLPRWVQAKGGWTWQGAPEAFERYAVFVLNEIAPSVRDWITINEPMVHLGGGYVLGLTPPGTGNSSDTNTGTDVSISPQEYLPGHTPTIDSLKRIVPPLVGLLNAHARAYHALHKAAKWANKSIRIGIAHHLRIFDAKDALNPLDLIATSIVDNLWNWSLPDALTTGTLRLSIPFVWYVDTPIEGLSGTQDFLGVNYYTRDIVALQLKGGISISMKVKQGAAVSDLGWEIYPRGFYRILKSAHARYGNLPVIVTENGVADATDAFRLKFLKNHLYELHRAILEGVPVEGYCHWSLMDNFEWVEGFGPRFGLYEVDYSNQRRTPRPSAHFFSRLTTEYGFDND